MKYRMAGLKLFLAIEYCFPCVRSLIKTCEGLGEFEIVIHTKMQVEGLVNK